MNSTRAPSNGRSQKLQPSGKSVSCDCIKASSCIELADIRKLDSLLNQCESISCDNLLLYDEIYNYDLCATTTRKYVSTSALHKILPKNSIRRRTHKKVLAIRENDSKIIKFIDDKRHTDMDERVEAFGELTKCCELHSDKCVGNDDEDDLFAPRSCLMQKPPPKTSINCCDKTIQTSYGDLYSHPDDVCKYLTSHGSHNNHKQQTQDKRKKSKRKLCSCRDYENANVICETSLTTVPVVNTLKVSSTPSRSSGSTPLKSALQLRREKSNDKSMSGVRSSRFTKQKNTIVDDDECFVGENVTDVCHDNRVININDKSVEIIPISLNSLHSQSLTPRGTSTNLLHDSKSEKSETQSQKFKRSKFSPSFISRKLTSRLNSDEDGAGGVMESLLGRAISSEKKLPEPVETVCIDDNLLSF